MRQRLAKWRPPSRPLTPKELAAEIQRLKKELAPRLPDIDEGDLTLILHSVLRPVGSGRPLFLKRQAGHYVF